MEKTDEIVARLDVGDAIIHPQRGAGTVEKIVSLGTNGDTRRYYSIRLFTGEGTLFVPVDEIEGLGLRPASYGEDAVRDILANQPRPLDDDYRIRQNNVRERIKSGNLPEVARALRDLAYRERVDRLTKVDEDLKKKAQALLTSELAAYARVTLETATGKLNRMLKQAMQKHAPRETD